MPFGLGKSEKRPEDEGEAVREEALEGSEAAPAADADSPLVDSPAAGGQGEASTSSRSMSFRPAYLDEAPSREGTATSQATPAPEGDAFFVSVTRQHTTETHRFDNPAEAQTFLEKLLEEGVPKEEVSAFSGRKLAFKVSHRPIVKLSGARD